MTSAALILAAGESRRFGGFPKALLKVGERTAVRRLAETCLRERYDPVALVVGAHRAAIVHEMRGLPVELVDAENWYEGRTASVQAGLSALPRELDVMLWPVDHPFVSASTLLALESMRAHDLLGSWFIPTFEGRGGHPVLWRSEVRPRILELRTDAPLRSLLPEFGPQVRRVAVDDPAVVANVDTPEEYRLALDAWSDRRED